MFDRLFKRSRHNQPAAIIYRQIVESARNPAFYRDWGVPDSLDGRFEMLVIHAFLVMHRLKGHGAHVDAFTQALFDEMFADLDAALRETGVSDIRIGDKVKQMVSAFYGRVSAYEIGLAGADSGLQDALQRNVYGTVAPSELGSGALASYIRVQDRNLRGQDPDRIIAGLLSFLAPDASNACQHPNAGP